MLCQTTFDKLIMLFRQSFSFYVGLCIVMTYVTFTQYRCKNENILRILYFILLFSIFNIGLINSLIN